MKRRKALALLGASANAMMLFPGRVFAGFSGIEAQDRGGEVDTAFSRLKGEPMCRAEIRTERGGPRLFVNGDEVYPFLALSDELLHTAAGYRDSGITMFTPILGLNISWIAPGKFDFSAFDLFFARLLAIHPAVKFLPRLHLNPPLWWKEAHPDELVKCGLTTELGYSDYYKRPERIGESGLNWNGLTDPYDASWASELWRKEIGEVLRAYLQHVESSPLASRVIGYQVAYGHTGEWHYTGMRFIPDYSEPMKKAIGPIPEVKARLTTTAGLLRDPAREKDVIEFYGRHHDLIADTLLHFANITKEATARRIIVGAFFGYLLENVHIQEGGHLSPERVLASPDIDFLASPYTYQHTNIPTKERWESDMVDDAGNWLGRARGVGGDGSNRVLVESIHRHGKMFFMEMDPSTYLEPRKAGEGGTGHDSVAGSVRILRRDTGHMFAKGIGGWFFDFGYLCPPFEAHHGWYNSPPLIDAIKPFAALGPERARLDIASVAQVAGVYDPKTFFATEHWKAEEPWTGFGIAVCDHINHWFINSQQRTLLRMGTPLDNIYRSDLTKADMERFRILFMTNLFMMDDAEVKRLRSILEGSGVTVVWYYAPGYVAPDKLDLAQMERLTGFRFEVLNDPGPMQIAVKDGMGETMFGTRKAHNPRCVVLDDDVEVLGTWADNKRPAFVRKSMRGYTSIYVGAAPITVNILRSIAKDAGVHFWSDRTDVVYATKDAATVIATAEGERELTFLQPMQPAEGGEASVTHKVRMEFGDVRVFIAPRT